MHLAGKPILFHSIAAFAGICNHVLLVLQEKDFNYWQQICAEHHFNLPVRLVPGGKTRHESVKNAVQLLPDDVLVAIHDGARPLVTSNLIKQLLLLAGQKGNAIPVIPFANSIRKLSQEGNQNVNRNEYVSVQTPQCFQSSELKQAFNAARSSDYSDEASLYDDLGKAVYLNEGQRSNIKVTNPEDMVIAEVMHLAFQKAKNRDNS